jgi:hypothetical protein
MKLAEICRQAQSSNTDPRKVNEWKYRLWSYCENKLIAVCQGIDSN